MFEPNISENQSTSLNSGLLDSNSLLNSSIGLTEQSSLLDFSSQSQLAINSGFESEYIDRTLEKTTIINKESLISRVGSVEQLTTQGSNDPLTGLSANASVVGKIDPLSVGTSALGTKKVRGTLGADRFTINSNYNYIISGNGNVNYSSGLRDYIDLSGINSSSVAFNFVSSTGSSGGVLYNPGSGNRLFDSMTLSNGSKIYFEGIDNIRFANGTANLSTIPNDPYFNSQWNLHMMGVHNAWWFTKGSTNVMLGVEDSGLGVNSSGFIHPDLPNTTVYTNNYRDEFSDTRFPVNQRTSHGTAVQGIMAAKSNNGLGMSGINWNSEVFHIDVIPGNELGDQSLATATQNMINYANSQGKRLVINMSLGGGSSNSAFNQLVANNQSKALFVIASGNSGQSSIAYPAILANSYSNVIAVGAANTSGQRINYSQYGVGLTLMGPSEVISAKASGLPYPNNTSNTQFSYYGNGSSGFNGTSAAAPNVAGVASLVWSANPNLSASGVKQILSQTAVDLGTSGYDYFTGSGFVNADAAVRRALAVKRTGSFSSALMSGMASNDYELSAVNVLSQNQGEVSNRNAITTTDLIANDSRQAKTLQVVEAPSMSSVEIIDIPSPAKVAANVISLTGNFKTTQLRELESASIDSLMPGLDFYSSLVKHTDELMGAYS
ncbi:peptidase S8 and S53 subtilisin kexin sedolisin [Aphanothece hegewaldii CCALA 016]|uniref:Peptidase S8 and S53 subtilisin kexin sedolisin n=1 Tax=Aphanothece hegewaldii CCALA 016 TaxID=2107694 RepID=A0A2T1LXF3_9CHRO|nr:S8 family serine peptidase [Aphanothece hegewaldii]PSF37060.1 peptidase S8 and S53 subtilisin kexin sedolisin [Aphanothece hegewaldii CCALA 016]